MPLGGDLGTLLFGPPPVEFLIGGQPVGQGSKSIGRHGQLYEAGGQTWKAWRATVKDATEAWTASVPGGWVRLDEPVVLGVWFVVAREQTLPRWRWWPWTRSKLGSRDLAKLVRAVEDGLSVGGLWADDARVIRYIDLGSRYVTPGGGEQPYVWVRVWPAGHLERGWQPPTPPAGLAVLGPVTHRPAKRIKVGALSPTERAKLAQQLRSR